MEDLTVEFKGSILYFNIENRVIFMRSDKTGEVLIRLGTPEEARKEVLYNRKCPFPQMIKDFVKAWKASDIEKVKSLKTDKALIEDMREDFKLMGYTILK